MMSALLATSHTSDVPIWLIVDIIVVDVILALIVLTGRLRP